LPRKPLACRLRKVFFFVAMSLSLHQRLLHESAGTAPPLPRGLRLPWRDSATQQLNALEAANRRLSANRIGGQWMWIGLVALTLLLAVATSSWDSAPRQAGSRVVATPTPTAPALLPLPVTMAQPQPLPIAQPEAPSGPPPGLALIDEAAQQQAARARVLAEARRQAARAAQERLLAEKDALRASERRPPERTPEAPPARVAEAPVAVAVQAVAPAAPRAGVRETCNGAGFFGQALCQARECRKPEREDDATCVRLRELEQARARIER
jgi:hypothetical protein